jgi:hypothetical protein
VAILATRCVDSSGDRIVDSPSEAVAVTEKNRQEAKDQPKLPANETEAKAHVGQIIKAAEKAATGIVAEAEAKAAKYVEETRLRTEEIAAQQAQEIWTLTDALIARAEAVKSQSDELLRTLSQTRRGAEAAIKAAPQSKKRTSRASSKKAAQPPVGTPPPPAPSPPDQPSEGAQLLATQMAVAGSTREEIASRLRNDFGVGDAESMLDSILGAG